MKIEGWLCSLYLCKSLDPGSVWSIRSTKILGQWLIVSNACLFSHWVSHLFSKSTSIAICIALSSYWNKGTLCCVTYGTRNFVIRDTITCNTVPPLQYYKSVSQYPQLKVKLAKNSICTERHNDSTEISKPLNMNRYLGTVPIVPTYLFKSTSVFWRFYVSGFQNMH